MLIATSMTGCQPSELNKTISVEMVPHLFLQLRRYSGRKQGVFGRPPPKRCPQALLTAIPATSTTLGMHAPTPAPPICMVFQNAVKRLKQTMPQHISVPKGIIWPPVVTETAKVRRMAPNIEANLSSVLERGVPVILVIITSFRKCDRGPTYNSRPLGGDG